MTEKRPVEPVTSLEDQRLQEIFARKYSVDAQDPSYDHIVFQQALGMAKGERLRAEKIYQELRRTIDGMSVINRETLATDHFEQMMDAFVNVQKERLDILTEPTETPLPTKE